MLGYCAALWHGPPELQALGVRHASTVIAIQFMARDCPTILTAINSGFSCMDEYSNQFACPWCTQASQKLDDTRRFLDACAPEPMPSTRHFDRRCDASSSHAHHSSDRNRKTHAHGHVYVAVNSHVGETRPCVTHRTHSVCLAS